MDRNIGAVVAIVILMLAASIGLGFMVGQTFSAAPSPAPSNTTDAPYTLTMVEIMENQWNATAEPQPVFFVLGPNGLESSANLTLPADRTIQLTMIAYDTPTEDSTAAEATVTGTVGGNMMLINGTVAAGMANSTMGTGIGAMTNWGTNVTSVPVETVAHTFSIVQLGINVPVLGGDTVMARLYFDKPGTYTWICETPCGFGQGGMGGAMAEAGWMMGSLTVK